MYYLIIPLSWFISHYFVQLFIFQKIILYLKKCILINYCEYPKTNYIEENNALFEVEDINDINFSIIPNAKDEIKPLLDIINQYSYEFFLDQVDYIIISKMDIEIIKINNKKYKTIKNSIDRSLVLEITKPNNNIWLFLIFLKIFIMFLITLIYKILYSLI